MIKQLSKIIGQSEAKAALNEIIAARNYHEQHKNKKPFQFPPLYFSGLSGTGKTHLAEKFAEALQEDGFQYFPFPVKAGWRFFETLATQACSINDKNGEVYAVPSVFFVDEAHEHSPIEEQLKLLTGIHKPQLFSRNGVQFFSDLSQHSWIFASNEDLDPAQKRRCIEIPFTSYTPEEKKKLFTLMVEQTVHEKALDYLESRTKPMAGDVEQVARRLNMQPVDKITFDIAQIVVKRMGLFPQGLVNKDLLIMLRMSHSERPTPIEALRATIGDVKNSATRNRLGWLMALELTESKKGGYALTTKGVTYLKDLAKLQAELKEKYNIKVK